MSKSRKMTWMVPEQEASYEAAVQGDEQPRMVKVSVTVDRGLLNLVDHFVLHHEGITRSQVFDEALELWAKQLQRRSDIECYADFAKMTESERQTAEDWKKIQTESAKEIW